MTQEELNQVHQKTVVENDKVRDAVAIVIEALKNDPAYYIAWQANIAMAFYDEYNNRKQSEEGVNNIHKIANDGAKRFLDLLTYEPVKA